MKIEKILLIDDDNISNFISKTTINRLQLSDNVIVKNNGFDGLKYVKECLKTQNLPNLILLDLKMPGMDGIEFLKELEKLKDEINGRIVTVVLTSSKAAEDLQKIRQIGAFHVLNKPLTTEAMLEICQKFFKKKEATA